MNAYVLFFLSLFTFMSGIIFFGVQSHCFFIQWPQQFTMNRPINKYEKKIVCLMYWHNNRWHKEKIEIVWSTSCLENIQQILSHWLSLLGQDEILVKKITIQSVTYTPNQHDIYLSFDRNPLAKEWSIYKKRQCIEGILATLRCNHIPLDGVFFLVNHHPIIDPHLDFTHKWPLQGFENLLLQ